MQHFHLARQILAVPLAFLRLLTLFHLVDDLRLLLILCKTFIVLNAFRHIADGVLLKEVFGRWLWGC